MKFNRHVAYLLICALLLGAVPVGTYLHRKETYSFYENRQLAVFSLPSWQQLWEGSALSELEKTAADRIAWREDALRADTALQLALNRPVVNDIVVTPNALLSYYTHNRWDIDYLTGQAEEAADRYALLAQQVASYGGQFCFVGLPLQSTYLADLYPDYLDSRRWHTDAIRAAFSHAMADRDVDFLDLRAVYDSLGSPHELYSATDHHFTFQGAFVAYQAIARHLDGALGSPSKEDFLWETLPNPFLGSSNRKLYGLYETDEKLELARPREDIPFTRTDNGKEVEPTVFSLPKTPEEQITYSLYMGGDVGETILSTNRPGLPRVLIYGDSFTNPLEALLWTGCDELRSLDLRYYTQQSLSEYIAAYRPDYVLCVRDESVYLSSAANGATQ